VPVLQFPDTISRLIYFSEIDIYGDDIPKVERERYSVIIHSEMLNTTSGEDRTTDLNRRRQSQWLPTIQVNVPNAPPEILSGKIALHYEKIVEVGYSVLVKHHGMIHPQEEAKFLSNFEHRRTVRDLEKLIKIQSLNARGYPLLPGRQANDPSRRRLQGSGKQSFDDFDMGEIVVVDSRYKERTIEAKLDTGSGRNLISSRLVARLGVLKRRNKQTFRLTVRSQTVVTRWSCFIDWWPKGRDTAEVGPCRSEFVILDDAAATCTIGKFDLFTQKIYKRSRYLAAFDDIAINAMDSGILISGLALTSPS
jgi:hypothetical protein